MAILVASIVSLGGCGKGESAVVTERDALLQIGDSTLYLNDVLAKLPSNLEKEDSAKMFATIVDTWIQSILLADYAEQSIPDMERIERLVENYRKQLIISEYRRILQSSEKQKVEEDKIKEYYETHIEDLILEQPLIKGVYLKIPEEIAGNNDVETLMKDPVGNNLDNLEKTVIGKALQYDYFMDTWVGFETIADQIPYRFFDADAFVESTPDFTTTYNGATYYLHITEYMNSGERIPYEFAKSHIEQVLSRQNNDEYERKLINGLYKQALKEGRLKKIGYDPVEHRRLEAGK